MEAVSDWVFLWKPEAKLEKGMHGHGAIALLSVITKWFPATVVLLLLQDKNPEEWKELHVDAGRCELRAHAGAGEELTPKWQKIREEMWVPGLGDDLETSRDMMNKREGDSELGDGTEARVAVVDAAGLS